MSISNRSFAPQNLRSVRCEISKKSSHVLLEKYILNEWQTIIYSGMEIYNKP